MPEHPPSLSHDDDQLLQRASAALARSADRVHWPAEAVLERARVIARRRRTTRIALTALVVAAVMAAIIVPLTTLGHRQAAPLVPAHQPSAAPPETSTFGARLPSSTTTVATPAASWAVAPSQVTWTRVVFPVTDGCGPGQQRPWVVRQETAMIPSGGPELAILLVHCLGGKQPGAPENLIVFDGATSATSPRYRTTLMGWPTQDYTSSFFSISGTTISITVSGYSRLSHQHVVHTVLNWRWAHGKFHSK